MGNNSVVEVKGKAGIVARVICDSISPQGVRLTTFEIQYPRIILSELNTHRMLSKNSASSRAIPFTKMVEQLGAAPVRFGAANKGMQDRGVDHCDTVHVRDQYNQSWWLGPGAAWKSAEHSALYHAQAFYEAGYHKQVVNRLVEPFQMMKTVISGTEWNNFFWLRDDDAADPTIRELARCKREAREQSEPLLIYPGEYHLPYVIRERQDDGSLTYHIELRDEGNPWVGVQFLDTATAIKVSCARTCAVSFRNEDYGIEKCLDVYDNKLLGQDKIHGSALEHAATPMEELVCESVGADECGYIYSEVNIPGCPETWQQGVTHSDRDGELWSGNFKQWIQHRKTIPNENYEG